ncbi:hypothetical protein JOD82_002136 [Paenibacillus sp. 1182]|uniref:hypothetical protein n=1 Tax=Paenibacillus sp. 1182 TaxID=2806565 RepID=UPI001AE9A2DC|nr:hypothetical protein [Paenibacillus sp. 1182]MBP1309116.1 hypothetical protein [Paenibacillus sp. 1182]
MNNDLNETFIEMVDTRVILDREDHLVCIVPNHEFTLKRHQDVPYLTLQDISTQLEVRFPMGFFIVDVWCELGLSGTIYRYNSFNKIWREHGTIKGYA